ncbi:MAG TPA: hypothetical protein VFT51_13960 [Bacillales bacterium]|nr:hypothetical protein [Bacillales bacterium]
MRLSRMIVVPLLSFPVVLTGCSLETTESPPVLTEAVQVNLHMESKRIPSLTNPENDEQDNTARIPDLNLPKELQRIQLFFKDVVPVYPDTLDEPIPNLEKRGAIVGLIAQIAKAVGPDGTLAKPDPQQNLDSYFNTTNKQLQDLKSPLNWKRIESNISRKIQHLEKAQNFSINKDFDGYLQPMIDQLNLAKKNKDYKAYAAASRTIIRLNHLILAAVHKE